VIGGLVVLAALAAFVLIVFQPQKLFIDDVVDEDLPGLVVAGAPEVEPTTPTTAATEPTPGPVDAAAEPEPTTTTTAPPPVNSLAGGADRAASAGAPVSLGAGEFASLDHPTSGTAMIVVQPDGSRLLRIEALDTDNGPDLRVVLSTAAVGSGDYGNLVELGGLKGNIGDQNYEIPADVDLTSIRSVVIWCERFSAPFGEAPIDVVV
jgi:hypothetical protein